MEVPPGTRESECRSCHAPIYWVRTKNDKNMPVDCEVDGAYAPSDRDPGQGVSHFGTCPDAKKWSHQGRA
jgi:hypothetical protein